MQMMKKNFMLAEIISIYEVASRVQDRTTLVNQYMKRKGPVRACQERLTGPCRNRANSTYFESY